MDAILRRLPTQDSLQARAPALAGLAFGVAVMVLGGLLVSTIYTGQGLSYVPVETTPVYPNF
ncbi:MAG: hypothetical protein QNJ16_07960 [Rhodobacter sp.]|nr:hypothetical protein [Rhodobacter sp.]